MKFTIGENIYELKYTVNSMADMEELTGKTMSEMMELGEVSAIRGMFWAGLVHDNKNMNLNEAGDLLGEYMKEHGMGEASQLIIKGLTEAGFITAQKPKATTRRK